MSAFLFIYSNLATEKRGYFTYRNKPAACERSCVLTFLCSGFRMYAVPKYTGFRRKLSLNFQWNGNWKRIWFRGLFWAQFKLLWIHQTTTIEKTTRKLMSRARKYARHIQPCRGRGTQACTCLSCSPTRRVRCWGPCRVRGSCCGSWRQRHCQIRSKNGKHLELVRSDRVRRCMKGFIF